MWWNGRHWGLKIPCLAACGFESRHQHEESPGRFLHQEARSGLLLSSKKRQTARTAWRSSRVGYFFCVSFFRNARMESGSNPFVGSFGWGICSAVCFVSVAWRYSSQAWLQPPCSSRWNDLGAFFRARKVLYANELRMQCAIWAKIRPRRKRIPQHLHNFG